MLYLGVLVLLPLSTVFIRSSTVGWDGFWQIISEPRLIASYQLSFGAALTAAVVNVVFGLIVAWVLVRYSFPGKRLVDGMIDLPFALPTAVAGISLTALYSPNGWFGRPLDMLGIKAAYTPLGIVIALTFVGMPFVVRVVQPILESLGKEIEEAAFILGAGPWDMFRRVVFPELAPALMTGFALSFARALGEYGSVVFIAGNMPMRTEITPLLIMIKLEQFDYAGASALAVLMMVLSFIILLAINRLQWYLQARHSGQARGKAARVAAPFALEGAR